MPLQVTVLCRLGKGVSDCATAPLPFLEVTGPGLACLPGALLLDEGFPLLKTCLSYFSVSEMCYGAKRPLTSDSDSFWIILGALHAVHLQS